MQSEKPSRTARAAAIHRAAHQVLEQGRIFADPLAFRILGEDPESIVREAEEHPTGRRMRIFIAARTRFAEDALAAAFEGGVRQLVLLGAGLDTYAYRSHLSADGLHIFEVDHPATQVWKCQRLADAGIPIPKSLRFVSIDFERQSLAERLAASALDRTKQTFFSWLGVVPYLAEAAVWSTLDFIVSLPGGTHVVFDYSNPPALLPSATRIMHETLAARVAKVGEAYKYHSETDELHAKLRALGFAEIEDLGPRQIAERYFPIGESTLPASTETLTHRKRIMYLLFKSQIF